LFVKIDMGVEETVFVLSKFGGVNKGLRQQFMVYLAQTLAVDLGYRYRWFGIPYSEELYGDLETYSLHEEGYDMKPSKPFLKESEQQRLLRVREIIVPPKGIFLDKWIEMLATIHYFRNICYVEDFKTGNLVPSLFNTFCVLDENRATYIRRTNSERKFSLGEFKFAWDSLEQFGILDKKHDRPVS